MLVELYLLLPLVLVVVGLVIAWRHRRSTAVRWMVTGAVVGGLAASALYVLLILRQRSSTAAIGIIFVPWTFGIAAVIAAAWSLCLYQLARTAAAWRQGPRAVALWLIAVAFLAGSGYLVVSLGANVATFHRLQDPGVPAGVLAERYRAAMAKKNYLQLSAIAANRSTPPPILLEMARSDDPGMHAKRGGLATMFDRDALAVVRKVIRNPSMPPEAIPYLAASTNEYVLSDVAFHRETPEPILREIAARNDGYLVHWGLAGNPNTPREILERLATDGDRVTAQNLASNPSTPLPILARLAGSPEQFVRWGVARNPSIDAAIAERLRTDPDETTRFYLAHNRATPREVLDKLAGDPSERVRRYAGEALKRTAR